MEGQEREREPWELDEYPEGFDVYQYDAVKAGKSQRLVLAVFAIAFLLFLWGTVNSYLESRQRAQQIEQFQQARKTALGKK